MSAYGRPPSRARAASNIATTLLITALGVALIVVTGLVLGLAMFAAIVPYLALSGPVTP